MRKGILHFQGDKKLPSLKSLQAEQQRLYDERTKLKKQAKEIDTVKSNIDSMLHISSDAPQQATEKVRSTTLKE